MFNKVLLFSLFLAPFTFIIPQSTAGTFYPDKYEKVSIAVLRTSPEKYKNKKIFWETQYYRLYTDFPNYMQKSGLKSSKYAILTVNPKNVPLVVKKKDFNDLIINLKPRAYLKAYGRIKKFKRASKAGLPSYYLSCEHIEVVEKPEDKEALAEDNTSRRLNRRNLRKRNWRRQNKENRASDKAGIPIAP